MSDSLAKAHEAIDKTARMAKFAILIPVPTMVFIYWGLGIFQENWHKDPFLLLMYLVFFFGQCYVLYQYALILRGTRRAQAVVDTLHAPLSDLKGMLAKVSALVPCHMRDLGERLLQLVLRDPGALLTPLLDNAGMRRSQRENKIISLHVSINRTLLKLGFLGTLIGLLMTFPPMKSAILALRESGGEMRFVKDIAQAIDGDHFAIYTTLLATAVSTLIELITIQVLERVLGRFELANSYVDEWVVTELEPASRQLTNASHSSALASSLEEAGTPEELAKLLAGHLGAVNQQVARGVVQLSDAVTTMGRQLESVLEVQSQIGRRVDRLLQYEAEIRGAEVSRENASGKGAEGKA